MCSLEVLSTPPFMPFCGDESPCRDKCSSHHTTTLNSTGAGILHNINPERQWIFELEALFTKASYWQKIQMLTIVHNRFIPENATLPSFGSLMKRKSLCNRIIFRDSGYVVIDWIGLCATFLSLFVVFLLGYNIQSVEWLLDIFLDATRQVWERFTSTDSDPLPKSRW